VAHDSLYRPLSAEQMATIGNLVIPGVSARIHKGHNVGDGPAKPLKPGRTDAADTPIRNGAGTSRYSRSRVAGPDDALYPGHKRHSKPSANRL